MSRPTFRMKWLSGILAAYLLLIIYAPISMAAETQQAQANETRSIASNNASSTINVQSYVDVPDQAWYAKSVNDWIALGILRPKQGDKFEPKSVMTRGDFAFLLAYSLGLAPSSKSAAFKDLPHGEQAGYIAALQETGLVKGYPDVTFRPNSPVTRAEAASWIASAKKLEPVTQTSSLFRDVPPKSWYSGAVDSLVKAGFLSGKSKDQFAPADFINRAETIALLDRSFYSPSLIQDIREDGTIIIDGHAYRAAESVKGIFQSSNKAILHNAAIQFTHDGDIIVSVENLMVGYKGALAGEDKPLVLNAEGNTINGIIMVDADQITLANLEVKGDLLLGRGFQSHFFAYDVHVKGETVYFEDFGRPKAQIANLEFQKSELGKLVLGNSANVKQVDIDPDKLSRTSINPKKAVRFLAPGIPSLPPVHPSLSPGLYVQVVDGLIILSNPGGSSNFSAGQFGFVPSMSQPPIIVPPNPGLKFQPPSFKTDTGNSTGKNLPSTKDDSLKLICDNVNCNVEAFVNSQIDTSLTGSISTVTVHTGASLQYLGSAQIDTLTLGDSDSTGSASFTGTANIKNVKVNGKGGPFNLNLQGTIGTLETTGNSQLMLTGSATIGNLTVPSDVDPKSVFTNPSDLSKVSAINGSRTVSFCALQPADPSCQVITSPPAPLPDNSPILNSLVNETVTADSAQFKITSTNTNTLYYVLLPSVQPAPSASQVKQGQNAAGADVGTSMKGNQPVAGTTSSVLLSQLTFDTSYTLYVVGYNGAGGLSPVRLLNFMTANAITSTVTDAVYNVVDGLDHTVNVNVSFANATKLYYVVTNDEVPANADQVKSAGNFARLIQSDSFDVTDLTQKTFQVTVPNSFIYSIYFVVEAGGRLSDVYPMDFQAPAAAFTLEPLEVPSLLHPGDSFVCAVNADYLDGTRQDVTSQATIVSSDPSVISVDANGQGTVYTVGSATITATYQSQSRSVNLNATLTMTS